jgi:hypothetical protein
MEPVHGEHLVGLRKEEGSHHVRERHRVPPERRDHLVLRGREPAGRQPAEASQGLR